MTSESTGHFELGPAVFILLKIFTKRLKIKKIIINFLTLIIF